MKASDSEQLSTPRFGMHRLLLRRSIATQQRENRSQDLGENRTLMPSHGVAHDIAILYSISLVIWNRCSHVHRVSTVFLYFSAIAEDNLGNRIESRTWPDRYRVVDLGNPHSPESSCGYVLARLTTSPSPRVQRHLTPSPTCADDNRA